MSLENNNGILKEGELELINQYARSELKADDVYAFTVVLCDNEIDRDNERFSDEALEELAKLFVGVTGVRDHDAKTGNQTARIFSCRTELVAGRLTSDGLAYKRLVARAYMPKSSGNEEFITLLESGIRKEVSVGCAVSVRKCSICGGDSGSCGHIRGRSYGGRLCFATLEKPTDAYEWSFVAVPAQKSAGVIKGYRKGNEEMDIEKRIFGGGEISLTAEETEQLAVKMRAMREMAADGEAYRSKLQLELQKASAAALPELDRDVLAFIMEKMSASQLESLLGAMKARAEKLYPLSPQLAPCGEARQEHENNAYRNI